MNYKYGLDTLNNLFKGTVIYADFAIFEAALYENLDSESKYGPDEQTRRSRARIVDQLNILSIEHTGYSFNDICLGKAPSELHSHTVGRLSNITILFLAADPTDASRLRLGEEIREIQEKLSQGKFRERFQLHYRMSVRPADLSNALLEIRPHVVHFSGHGTSSGELCFENQSGGTHLMQPGALASLFEQFSDQILCVILNACYSRVQADAISKNIRFVIGMDKAIGDKAAIAFTVGFYQAFVSGCSVEESYKLGCIQIRLQGIPEYLTPFIISNSSED